MTSAFRVLVLRLRAAPPRSGEHWLTRFVFLRLLGLVYFFAFLSLANQVLPLIGSRGLLPARIYLEAVREGGVSPWQELPTLFWFSHSDANLQAGAWIGVGLSLLLLAGLANALLLAALWALYLSFVHVGQVWYGYGWEIQLLETGFLAIFLCPLLDPRPFPRLPPPFPVLLCLRWLIVRIMLGAGLIKIRGDSCWRDLTCLLYHYETQPIPNPLSRLLHFLPPWIHRLECLGNHLVELVAPAFAFGPAAARRIAGLLFVAFQLFLILSGNLSFLNYLTIAPALACLDDGVWRRILPRRLVAAADRAREIARPSKAHRVAALLLAGLVAVLSFWPVRNLLSSRQMMNTSFNALHLVNTYGAFGSVGRERSEIVLEGTDEEAIGPDSRWRAYEFKAKPGDPERALPVVAPYHYRVDWQVWFAAMSTPGRHAWLVHLVWKLLHNDRGALSLLANDPFPDAPPRFIRAELYRYKFTRPFRGGPYWERARIGSWLPPMSTDDPRIREFLGARGLLEDANEKEIGPNEPRGPR
ncbi:MAG TPA: lipase maturation factor family protein [Planctomycetota bacterium]|jgi:hypothetical protein|nr:lipase maturation factor family protein [Planctomycetota bacterium]